MLRRMSTLWAVWNFSPATSHIRSMSRPPTRSTRLSSTSVRSTQVQPAMPHTPQSLTWLPRMMWRPNSAGLAAFQSWFPTSMPQALAQRTSVLLHDPMVAAVGAEQGALRHGHSVGRALQAKAADADVAQPAFARGEDLLPRSDLHRGLPRIGICRKSEVDAQAGLLDPKNAVPAGKLGEAKDLLKRLAVDEHPPPPQQVLGRRRPGCGR